MVNINASKVVAVNAEKGSIMGRVSAWKIVLHTLVLLASVLGLGSEGCVESNVTYVTVSPDSLTLAVDDTATLAVTSTSLDDTVFIWQSGNDSIATVTGGGLVTGIGPGITTITAMGDSSFVSGSATVTVMGPGEGEGEGEMDVVAVRVGMAFVNPGDPDDAGWASITDGFYTTSGNPGLGGHGPVGTNPGNTVTPTINVKAAYDDTNLYMQFVWADDTQDDAGRKHTFDATAGTWTTGGNEDRLYVMWPIVDGPGRQGEPFSVIGCAMTCHPRSESDRNMLSVVDNAVAVENCGACHPDSGSRVGQTPPFAHPLVFEGAECGACHTPTRGDVAIPDVSDGGDMIAPANTAYDIWHWKAQRSNPLAVVEDQYTANANRRARDGANLAPDNAVDFGVPRYVWADVELGLAPIEVMAQDERPLFQSLIDSVDSRLAELQGDGTYVTLGASPVLYAPRDGQTVSRHILRDDLVAAGDASANALATGTFGNGTWAVVIARSLTTADPDIDVNGMMVNTDLNFTTTETVQFSVATTNNSGAGHHGVAGPLTISFQN